MQKPVTVPFFTYYLNTLFKFLQAAGHLLSRVAGRWYCGYCRKTHMRRTVSFDYSGGLAENVCSLGMEALQIPMEDSASAAPDGKHRLSLSLEEIEDINAKLEEAD